jgi:Holliday junction resolvase
VIEKDVKRKVAKILHQHGWFHWMPPANAYGRSGVSDFHALRRGKFLAVETKVGKNQPTVLQDKFLNQVKVSGGKALVVNEKNLDWFEKMVK